MWESLTQDLSYAVRGFRRSPGLTATIILTFALGVGVNAAMFTVVDRLFFRPPSGVVDPASIRRLLIHDIGDQDFAYTTQSFTTNQHVRFGEAIRNLGTVEGYDVLTDRTVGESQEHRSVGFATTGFLEFAGVHPYRGRFFDAEENRYGDPRNVAILGYGYWRTAFGADLSVIGRPLRIDTTTFTVIGIAPPRFEGLDVGVVDIWAPLASMPAGLEGSWWGDSFQVLNLFVRVAPGVNERSIEARLDALYRAQRREQSLRSFGVARARDSSAHLELGSLSEARSNVWMGPQHERSLALTKRLAGVALLVLAIAIMNVAGLLLMRALRRRREIAVRIALGISPARLLRQFVAESVLLAIVGGAFALLIATWTGAALRRLLLADVHWTSVVVESRVVFVAVVLSIFAGVVAGLAPAATSIGRDLAAALKTGGAEFGRARSALRVWLLVGQMAMCMVLLAASGVFLQSLRNATMLDFGFDPDRLISFSWIFADDNLVEEVVGRIRALPEVASVSRSAGGTQGAAGGAFVTFRNGDTVSRSHEPSFMQADTAYLRTMGLRLLTGRFISATDQAKSEPVVVITQAMANAYWRGHQPIGDCFHFGRASNPCMTIVGVVSDPRWQLATPPRPQFFLPSTQGPYRCSCSTVTVRTRGAATATTVASIRRILAPFPFQAGYPPTPKRVTDRLEPQIRPWRIAAAMFGFFGLLALAAAGAGIYGLVGYEVTQRTHEIGVRMTLGANAQSILSLIVTSGARMAAMGIVAGIVAALFTGRIMASLLFDTSPYDPAILMATALTLGLVSVFASLVPAWRATRVDPMIALRAE